MKKWLIGIVTTLIVIGGGLWYADYKVKQAIGNQVVTILKTHDLQNIIAQAARGKDGIGTSSISSVNPSAVVSVSSKVGQTAQSTTPNETETTGSATTPGPSTGSATTTDTNPKDSPSTQAPTTDTHPSSGDSVPVFTSREDIINYAMSKFTPSELAQYAEDYANRKSLTSEQKAQLEQQILSHFTAQEISAMQSAAQKYP